MRSSRDLLCVLLLLALPLLARPRPPPHVGPPQPIEICAVWVEAAGAGVGCVSEERAQQARVAPGDRLSLDGDGRLVRGRMAPARLSAWQLPVDLNHATVEELASLEGIGPKLAARIVAARPIVTLDDLRRVRGLGGRRLEKLQPRLSGFLDE